MQKNKNVLFYTIDYLKWGEHVNLYGQYNKFLRILVVLLPTIVLHLNFSNADNSLDRYGDTGKVTFNSLSYKPFYYLNYFSAIAFLPEEEAAAIHYIKSATRYYQHPQRFIYNDLYAMAIPFINLSLCFCLFLYLYKKQVNNTHEIAVHTGGHAPPWTAPQRIGIMLLTQPAASGILSCARKRFVL